MEIKFKIGDVVHLKGQPYPRMTINHVGATASNVPCECMWFEGVILYKSTFSQDALELYEPVIKKETINES